MKHLTILYFLFISTIAFSQSVIQPSLYPTSCNDNDVATYKIATKDFQCVASSSGGIPTGLITFILSGTCPTGWSEVAALNGKAIYGTLTANADVGTSVGSATITPTTSSISLTATAQTPNALTAAAQTISYPVNTPTQAADTFGTTKFTTSGSGTAAFTSETARGAISWPVNPPTNSTSTVTGTMNSSSVTGTITMNSFVPQFSGIKAIFCGKD